MAFTINGTTGINLATQPLTGSLPDANAPSGSVIQVVQGTLTTTASTTSSTYIASGLTATITPSSASNKIIVMVNGGKCYISASQYIPCTLYRNGSEIGASARYVVGEGNPVGTNHSFCYLDLPSTTSAVTYAIYYRSSGGATAYFSDAPSSTGQVNITLMEIAA